MAALWVEREAWKMMSPSRSAGSARAQPATVAITRNAAIIRAMHFLLFYTYVPDILERRPQFRGAHIKHARESVARGELLLGGALADPVDLGVLFFSAPSRDVVEAFAKADPYVTGGLVTEWKVRPWTTVIGEGAANPLPPGL